ncbi:MAG: large extracellular alpha-helical protein, partial [Proteobacteria bacterium]|nr:large extracellular alpha-helical protein [Pseudomonadota bacterium]
MSPLRRLLPFAALLLPALTLAANVRQFTPQGQIDQQTRATAVFNTDMVPLGKPDAAAPFNVVCGKVGGKGRWGDARTWSYQLDRALQPGERCEFQIKPNLKAANGEAVTQALYQFFAAGPWPRSISPSAGSTIEEDQGFLITTNSPLNRASIEKNVWCEADGVGNRIPIRLLPDSTRKEMLASQSRKDDPTILALTCNESLPSGAKMRLVWGKDVATSNGIKSSRDSLFQYKVRAPFRATVSCERERANAPCSPLSDLRLEFSTAIDAKLGMSIKLITPEGARSPSPRGREEEKESTLSEIRFKKPLPQNAELRIELPAGIKDETGRALQNASNFPLKMRTGNLPPLAKFPGSFGIVEQKEGGVLPVTLRQIEAPVAVASQQVNSQRLTDDAKVIATMRELAKFEQQTKKVKLKKETGVEDYEDPYYARELSYLKNKSGISRRSIPKPGGSAEFEVIGIPLEKPGFHVVEIESRMLGAGLLASPKPMYVRTTVLNTNLAVHFKR